MARLLLPREHGAYAALAFPVATALAIGRVTAAALALTAAAGLAFAAHESLLVAIGARGRRAAKEDGRRARLQFGVLGALAGAALAAGLALGPGGVARAGAAPAALALATGAAVLAGREKTLVGELFALGALVSIALPVGLAARVPPGAATAAVSVWGLTFAAGALAVRATVAKPRPHAWLPAAMRAASAAVGLAGAASAAGIAVLEPLAWLPGLAAAAALPGSLLAAALGLRRVPPRHLRRIGWAMVAADAVTLALLVAALR
jgi:hypothetical protein